MRPCSYKILTKKKECIENQAGCWQRTTSITSFYTLAKLPLESLYTILRAIGSFFMVGGGELSKNVSHHGSRTTKNKKNNRLKHLKAVPQKTKLGPKYKWFKISHLESFFENITVIQYNFFIFVHTFLWTSSEFF